MNRTARSLRVVVLASFAALLATAAACSSASGALGSDCLRDDDCAVGVCFALKCRLPPTNDNARASGGANAYKPPVVDAGAPAPEDAATPAIDAAAPAEDAAPPPSGDAG